MDYDKVIRMEDEFLNKQRIVQELQDQSNSLKKIKGEQSQALNTLNGDGDVDSRLTNVKDQIRITKDKIKQMTDA